MRRRPPVALSRDVAGKLTFARTVVAGAEFRVRQGLPSPEGMDNVRALIRLRGAWQAAAATAPGLSQRIGVELDRILAALVEADRLEEHRLESAVERICAVLGNQSREADGLRQQLNAAIREYLETTVPTVQAPASSRELLRFRPFATTAGVVVILAVILLVARGHGHAASGSQIDSHAPAAPPAATVLHGQFTATTMTCPGASEIPGDTCFITLTLPAGRTHVVVTSPGSAVMAIGIRDQAGRDLGPQTTGEHGTAVFSATDGGVGSYQLRVVNVSHPAIPFAFTVSVSTT